MSALVLLRGSIVVSVAQFSILSFAQCPECRREYSRGLFAVSVNQNGEEGFVSKQPVPCCGSPRPIVELFLEGQDAHKRWKETIAHIHTTRALGGIRLSTLDIPRMLRAEACPVFF